MAQYRLPCLEKRPIRTIGGLLTVQQLAGVAGGCLVGLVAGRVVAALSPASGLVVGAVIALAGIVLTTAPELGQWGMTPAMLIVRLVAHLRAQKRYV